MARKQGLKSQAKRLAARGRNGDDRLAHLSADEIAVLNSLQGGESINPDTGLPEYFSLKKVLKSAAKAAGALVGSYLGGPAGAAVGGGVVSALMGDSAKKALTTGLLSGLGAWGVQQTGVGDSLGIESLGSNADMLGRIDESGAMGGAAQTASGSSGGTGGGISALLPLLGLGAAAAGAAGTKTPKTKAPARAPDQEAVEYEPLDRDQLAYAGDPYSYGVFGPEFQYFNEVNPDLQPLTMRAGGRVGYKYGGDVTEGGKTQGDKERGGQGPKGGGSGAGGRKSDEPPHAGAGGGQTSGLGNRGPLGGFGNGGKGGMGDIDSYLDSLGVGTTPTTPSAPGLRPEIKRTGHWDNPDWDLKDWGAAMNKYKQRGAGWGFLDILGGPFVDVNPPDWDVPQSFEDGDWHTSTNIGGVVGTLGSLFTGVPFGGMIGSQIDDYLGIPDLYHGSWSLGHNVQDENTMNPSAGGKSGTGGSGGGGGMGGGTGKNVGISQIVPRLPAPVPSKTATAAPGDAQDDQTSNNGVDDQTGRVYQPLPNPYTYGLYDPEHAFFTGQLPVTELDMARGGHVAGPGDGQSDSIPAMLSNGEYVIDAETVSALGDGSTDAGAKKLDQMRHRIRKHKRGAKASKIPPKAKGLSSYMKEAA